MSEFLYLYRVAGDVRPNPEQSQQIMEKWFAWMKQLTDSGNLKDPGQPLEADGKTVRGASKTITDGPFFEAKDLVNGYSLIQADDLEHAALLAQGCPIFEFDGAVEVRPVRNMDL